MYKETTVRQVGLLISPPPGNFISCSLFLLRGNGQKKVMFYPFCVSICRRTAALLQFQTAPRFDAWVPMLQCGHTVLTGVPRHRTRLAVPHASTSRCGKNPQKRYPRGWIQAILAPGSAKSSAGWFPSHPHREPAAGWRCARGFSFSKAWRNWRPTHIWEPGNISRSGLKPYYHLKPVPSPVGCDGFPRNTGFPVGQHPAACKFNCGRGGRKTSPATTLLLSQLNLAQELEAVVTRIIILSIALGKKKKKQLIYFQILMVNFTSFNRLHWVCKWYFGFTLST